MNSSIIMVFQQMLYLTTIAVLILVIPSLLVGLVVAVFQAATQINEMTLSFLPKLVVVLIILALLAPWLMGQIINFTHKLIIDIPYIIG